MKAFYSPIYALRAYIYPLLLRRQNGHCARCPSVFGPFDIDHKVYNPMLTLNELQLLCFPCHKSITNFTTYKNRANPSKHPRKSRSI